MAARLDTPLSRALLDAGCLDAALLEEAVQQQAIHGGTLDTLLLERGAVDERLLAALIAEASGTAPVPLEVFDKPAAEAVRVLPERMALTMKLCPFAIDGTAIHLLCTSPLDRTLIEEVAAVLQAQLVPHVVPEVRLWQALQSAYGAAPDERIASLLADLHVRATVPAARGAAARQPHSANSLVSAARWDLVEALAHLAAQQSRDGIAHIAMSFARQFLPFAAMVGVRGKSCVGWMRAGPAEGVAFLNKPFEFTSDCGLDLALRSPGPSIGQPAITPGNAALFGWLGRRHPRTFVAIPIVVASRRVAALLADGGIRAREVSSLSELVSFASRLGPAFEALLRQRQHERKASLPPPSPEKNYGSALRGDAAQPFDIHSAVTVPLPTFAGMFVAPVLEDVPAPPPLLDIALAMPSSGPIAMPLVEPFEPSLSAAASRDGSNVDARDYLTHRASPAGPLLNAGLPLATLSPRHEHALKDEGDTFATAVWRGALAEAVHRSCLGRPSPARRGQRDR